MCHEKGCLYIRNPKFCPTPNGSSLAIVLQLSTGPTGFSTLLCESYMVNENNNYNNIMKQLLIMTI